MDEQEAIRRCKVGDRAALGVLFELHHKAVMRSAYGIVRSHEAAEDVTQQVFIELSTSIGRFDQKRPLAPWLHGIAVRLSLHDLRGRKGSHVPLEDIAELSSPTPSPEEAAEDSETSEAIWEALGTLDPKHRAAVVLRYYQGFSEAETATALNCRPGTVKSRLHNARRKLGRLLPAQEPFGAHTSPAHEPHFEIPNRKPQQRGLGEEDA